MEDHAQPSRIRAWWLMALGAIAALAAGFAIGIGPGNATAAGSDAPATQSIQQTQDPEATPDGQGGQDRGDCPDGPRGEGSGSSSSSGDTSV